MDGRGAVCPMKSSGASPKIQVQYDARALEWALRPFRLVMIYMVHLQVRNNRQDFCMKPLSAKKTSEKTDSIFLQLPVVMTFERSLPVAH